MRRGCRQAARQHGRPGGPLRPFKIGIVKLSPEAQSEAEQPSEPEVYDLDVGDAVTAAQVELVHGRVYDIRLNSGRWATWRTRWHNAKDWQVVLLDWEGGPPMVTGDPISRHWTRRGAKRASNWANLTLLPMSASGRFRYAVLPTRHPDAC